LKVGPDDVLVHYKDDLPLQAQRNLNFLDLTELPKVSLVAFQKPSSLVFKINGNFSDIYRLYTVRAVEFESSSKNDTEVTLFLAMGHRLSLTNETAALFDATGELLQSYNLDYLRKTAHPTDSNVTLSSNETASDGQLRQLMMKKGYGGMGFGMPVAVPMPYAYPVATPVAVAAPVYTPAMTCVNCGLYYGGVPPMANYY